MKFVPYEKMSKKQKKAVNNSKRSDSFGMSLVTRVSADETKYNRARTKDKQRKTETWD